MRRDYRDAKPHKLVIEETSTDIVEFELVHNEDCGIEVLQQGPDGEDIEVFTCLVQAVLDDGGLHGEMGFTRTIPSRSNPAPTYSSAARPMTTTRTKARSGSSRITPTSGTRRAHDRAADKGECRPDRHRVVVMRGVRLSVQRDEEAESHD